MNTLILAMANAARSHFLKILDLHCATLEFKLSVGRLVMHDFSELLTVNLETVFYDHDEKALTSKFKISWVSSRLDQSFNRSFRCLDD